MQRRIIQEVSVEGAQRRKPSNRIVRTQYTCAYRNSISCEKRVMIIFY